MDGHFLRIICGDQMQYHCGTGGVNVKMETLFVLFKLKPGVSMEDYRQFSQRVDQKATTSCPDVFQFRVHEVKVVARGEQQYQVAEMIDVESYAAWRRFWDGEDMRAVRTEWGKLCDADSMLLLCTERIPMT
jgi:hypothetical protein